MNEHSGVTRRNFNFFIRNFILSPFAVSVPIFTAEGAELLPIQNEIYVNVALEDICSSKENSRNTLFFLTQIREVTGQKFKSEEDREKALEDVRKLAEAGAVYSPEIFRNILNFFSPPNPYADPYHLAPQGVVQGLGFAFELAGASSLAIAAASIIAEPVLEAYLESSFVKIRTSSQIQLYQINSVSLTQAISLGAKEKSYENVVFHLDAGKKFGVNLPKGSPSIEQLPTNTKRALVPLEKNQDTTLFSKRSIERLIKVNEENSKESLRLRKSIEQEKDNSLKEQQKVNLIKQQERTRREFDSAIYLEVLFLSRVLKDPIAAAQLHQMASALQSSYRAFELIENVGEVGTLTAVAGVGAAVIALASLSKAGDSAAADRSLEIINQKLDQISQQLKEGFFRLEKKQIQILEMLSDLLQQLRNKKITDDALFGQIKIQLGVILDKIDRQVIEGKESQFQLALTKSKFLTPPVSGDLQAAYIETLSEFYVHATQVSKMEALSGATSFTNSTAVRDELRRKNNCEMTFASLPAALQRIGPLYRSVPAGVGLVNPVEWSRGALAYLSLRAADPEGFGNAISITQIETLWRLGVALKETSTAAGDPRNVVIAAHSVLARLQPCSVLDVEYFTGKTLQENMEEWVLSWSMLNLFPMWKWKGAKLAILTDPLSETIYYKKSNQLELFNAYDEIENDPLEAAVALKLLKVEIISSTSSAKSIVRMLSISVIQGPRKGLKLGTKEGGLEEEEFYHGKGKIRSWRGTESAGIADIEGFLNFMFAIIREGRDYDTVRNKLPAFLIDKFSAIQVPGFESAVETFKVIFSLSLANAQNEIPNSYYSPIVNIPIPSTVEGYSEIVDASISNLSPTLQVSDFSLPFPWLHTLSSTFLNACQEPLRKAVRTAGQFPKNMSLAIIDETLRPLGAYMIMHKIRPFDVKVNIPKSKTERLMETIKQLDASAKELLEQTEEKLSIESKVEINKILKGYGEGALTYEIAFEKLKKELSKVGGAKLSILERTLLCSSYLWIEARERRQEDASVMAKDILSDREQKVIEEDIDPYVVDREVETWLNFARDAKNENSDNAVWMGAYITLTKKKMENTILYSGTYESEMIEKIDKLHKYLGGAIWLWGEGIVTADIKPGIAVGFDNSSTKNWRESKSGIRVSLTKTKSSFFGSNKNSIGLEIEI